jgi:putative ABC transport system permease protein
VLNGLFRDLRFGVRLLRRQPLFAATTALSLALGITGTTTVFTLGQALLFRTPAGVGAPDRLVEFADADGDGASRIPYPDYIDLRRRMTTVAGLYGYLPDLVPAGITSGDGSQRAFAAIVTPNYFAVLGVPAVAGRLFSAADDEQEGASPLVVLGHRFWTRAFNADRAVVGRTVRVNGHPMTVAGVAGEGFQGTTLLTPDFWVPFSMAKVVSPGRYTLTNRVSTPQLVVGGRLRSGVTPPQAAAELTTIAGDIEQQIAGAAGQSFTSRRGQFTAEALSAVPAELRALAAGSLSFLMALLVTVLLIACANVSGVLLARAVARRREIALRLAVGAARRRLLRQLLTETLVLFALGGATGLLLARVMIAGVVALLPAMPRPVDLSLPLDAKAVLFAMLVCLVATVVSGLTPAFRASRADVVTALKQDEQGPSDRRRLRSVFVVAQVTFSIVLVVLAALFTQALYRAATLDRGFDTTNVDAVSLDLSSYAPEEGMAFARTLATWVRALPGIRAASLVERVPDGMATVNGRVRPFGSASEQASASHGASWEAVDPGFFATLRIGLAAGRDFDARDTPTSPPVAIVAAATARRLWPGENAVGKYVVSPTNDVTAPRLVVGVAADLGYLLPPGATPPLVVYVPLTQRFRSAFTVIARRGTDETTPYQIRARVSEMDPDLLAAGVGTLSERVAAGGPPLMRVTVGLVGAIGLVGLVLAAVGVYGVTAQAVTQRTREIGVRLAMGARRADVIALVLRQGLTLVAVGSALGLLLAAVVARAVRTALFGLAPLDPVAFGAAAALFALTGLVACWIPVYRATRINAIEALRSE